MGGEGCELDRRVALQHAPITSSRTSETGRTSIRGCWSIRAAIAAGVNVTFKILYNDAVAMTGGQSMDGPLSVPIITRQMEAEGARRIAVVTDEPEKYGARSGLAPAVAVHHRRELDAVQRAFREIPGVTVIVYDQTCAAEKRRRRKRGKYPGPAPARVHQPRGVRRVRRLRREVELRRGGPRRDRVRAQARHRPVVVQQGFLLRRGVLPELRHRARRRPCARVPVSRATAPSCPHCPSRRSRGLDRPYEIIVTGVGGTGVITIGALLGMAAIWSRRDARCSIRPVSRRRAGAVVSHVRIARQPGDITTTRIANGAADLVLGCDVVVTAGADTRATMRAGKTAVVVNTQETMTGDFTRNADLAFPAEALMRGIERAAGSGYVERVDATRISTALTAMPSRPTCSCSATRGRRAASPLSRAAVERAIAINGVAVEMNLSAFDWGRRTAAERDAVERRVAPSTALARHRAGRRLEYRGGAAAGARDPGIGDRAAGGVPGGLPGCDVRRPLPCLRRAGAGSRALACEGDARARGGGGPRLLQASRVQGRVRSRASARRAGVRRGSKPSSRATTRWNSTLPHHCSLAVIRTPANPARRATARG